MVTMIHTTYLLSRLCHFHAGKLVSINVKYKDLWKRMEKIGITTQETENE